MTGSKNRKTPAETPAAIRAAHINACAIAWRERVSLLRAWAASPGATDAQVKEWRAIAQEIARCYQDLTGVSLEVQS